ncbi:glutamine--fructose-6-phosphate transaminase (isomerizing) [Enterococcus malodoratus]|uniref:Glutamine--fructose-6-phosphate aminotransferase [isomerizing] n=1 Tax=Enterococcus malodoratus ATCC 43197 TaxID=1158601 RepID=R2S3E1_9ENTE|nr:glutamine--fructose-6-phosphate transaminase (isomerizing) [Enterococcus malodoratus]EOH82714.1 glutamine-fructose-6-phosphate transaminase (isomerizing) [Enterococcus malodoratus ATCC 43197]EOT70530.1 glutamine-fructose-6-phosphate transaminase (isomerizing) [Enterococcus malodoratus ATCC 43197]OJG64529.1 glutamine-fructose-6-phosphate transaminase (isomerizing) [Enterococcus malodoratus]SPW86723.1 glutamine-fructose-6-phosphate transaminase (isomerizing) [Enterococcus malodoratus]STC72060
MCGIVGIVGNEQATSILVNGLEKLEYRGYDSAGIFVADHNEDYLVKSQGRIKELAEKIGEEVHGTIGIGHTRWATHGEPSEENAHPHTSQSKRFVLVHNGVIENYDELKRKYLANDDFYGETDTEIAVHLIEYFAEQGISTKEAFRKALMEINGSYAFGLIDKNDRETIYVAKNKSPLLIGLGDGFNVVCSDAMAMLEQTNQFVEINDGEMVIVTKDRVEIEDEAGSEIQRAPYEAKIDLADMEKGTYPYYMLKEIDEQPATMRRIISEYTDETGTVVIEEPLLQSLLTSDRIYIVACGTSNNAGWASKQIIEGLANIPVEIHLSSEFGYNMPLLSEKPFFIYLTQSGETADSRQVLVKTNKLGYPSLTVTNVASSTLSREASYTMLLHAGPEIAVASTKAYTAQIAALTVLAKAVGEAKNIPAAEEFDLTKELGIAANAMDIMIAEKTMIEGIAEEYLATTRNAFYIGRSEDYYVSMEVALKLKEISYIQAEGFAAGELKHGTIALVEEGTPVIGIITEAVTAPHTRGNLREVESRGAHTLVIASEELSKKGDQIILPIVHQFLRPLVSVIPGQLIAYYATLLRGYDVDKPRNLAKSVTVE